MADAQPLTDASTSTNDIPRQRADNPPPYGPSSIHITYLDHQFGAFSRAPHFPNTANQTDAGASSVPKVVLVGPSDICKKTVDDPVADSKCRALLAYLARRTGTPFPAKDASRPAPTVVNLSNGPVRFVDVDCDSGCSRLRGSKPRGYDTDCSDSSRKGGCNATKCHQTRFEEQRKQDFQGAAAFMVFMPLDGYDRAAWCRYLWDVAQLVLELEKNAPDVPMVLVGYTEREREMGPAFSVDKSGVRFCDKVLDSTWFPVPKHRRSYPIDMKVRYWFGIFHFFDVQTACDLTWDEGVRLAGIFGAVAYAEINIQSGEGFGAFEEMAVVARCPYQLPKLKKEGKCVVL